MVILEAFLLIDIKLLSIYLLLEIVNHPLTFPEFQTNLLNDPIILYSNLPI